jgi:hypothetical protein
VSAAATGGCLCGAVRYRVAGPLRQVIACHCRECRRASGHYPAATAAARNAVVIEGEVAWFASSPAALRGFCRTCGSNLFWERPGSGRISIWAGSLDAPAGLRLEGHIFVAEKGTYYAIEDGLPQALRRDPELTG